MKCQKLLQKIKQKINLLLLFTTCQRYMNVVTRTHKKKKTRRIACILYTKKKDLFKNISTIIMQQMNCKDSQTKLIQI